MKLVKLLSVLALVVGFNVMADDHAAPAAADHATTDAHATTKTHVKTVAVKSKKAMKKAKDAHNATETKMEETQTH